MEHDLPKRSANTYLFAPKFREEPMLNQNIITHPNGQSLRTHILPYKLRACYTRSSNYTGMVKRKSWVHVLDSLRPVLSTNSKPQDSQENKLGFSPGFQQYLGRIPMLKRFPISLSYESLQTESKDEVQKPCKLVEYRRLTYYIHVWHTHKDRMDC